MSVEITRFSQQFSFIGLAETNVGSDAGSVYMIPGYKPFYQDTYNNKKKGTGVVLYVTENLTENLETIFVTVTDKTNSMTIGAIYRPPSADFSKSLEEPAYILQQLPKKCTHIMRDFNVDPIKIHLVKLKSLKVLCSPMAFCH